MALDEALLESAEADGMATVRFYQWREPTLSLGYFQRYEDRQLHCASAACAAVRRASGGGAILHDQELTYSIALSSSHPLAGRAERLYLAVHRSLVSTLAEFGVTASLRTADSVDVGTHNQKSASVPFLCFQRASPGDVLIGSVKIAGSAQRRHRGAVLQHGSVLLEKSAYAPELLGITDLVGIHVTVDQLQAKWSPRLAQTLGVTSGQLRQTVPQSIATRAEEIVQAKFATDEWTERR